MARPSRRSTRGAGHTSVREEGYSAVSPQSGAPAAAATDGQQLRPNTRIVAVVNQKGGVGKSTTTLNQALMTVDAGGTAVGICGDPQNTLGKAARRLERGKHGLPDGLEVYSEHDADELRKLRRIRSIDRVYVDTPGSLENEGRVRAVLEASDLAVIPYNLDVYSLEPTLVTAKLCEALGVPHRVLMVMVPPGDRGVRLVEEAREVLDARQVPYFKAFTRAYVAYSDCIKDGVPLTLWRGTNAANACADQRRVHTAIELELSRLGAVKGAR